MYHIGLSESANVPRAIGTDYRHIPNFHKVFTALLIKSCVDVRDKFATSQWELAILELYNNKGHKYERSSSPRLMRTKLMPNWMKSTSFCIAAISSDKHVFVYLLKKSHMQLLYVQCTLWRFSFSFLVMCAISVYLTMQKPRQSF